MNRSWNSNPTSSPGFVYFQQENNQHDSPDYLSFGSSPMNSSFQRNNFSPSHYSSPRSKHPNYKRFNSKHGFINRSYNSSNDSFGSQDSLRGRHRRSIKADVFHGHNFKEGKRDMSHYLDLSCTKDPWEELEKICDEKEKVNEVLADNSDINEENSNGSSSEDETDSVTDNKSSSVTTEDET